MMGLFLDNNPNHQSQRNDYSQRSNNHGSCSAHDQRLVPSSTPYAALPPLDVVGTGPTHHCSHADVPFDQLERVHAEREKVQAAACHARS